MQKFTTGAIKPVNSWSLAARYAIDRGVMTAGDYMIELVLCGIAVPPSGAREIVRTYNESAKVQFATMRRS